MSLRWLLLIALPLLALSSVGDIHSSVVILGVVAIVAALALYTVGFDAVLRTAPTTGPSSDERCLRGSFRRQSSPDAPGRPQPRAPGNGLRLLVLS